VQPFQVSFIGDDRMNRMVPSNWNEDIIECQKSVVNTVDFVQFCEDVTKVLRDDDNLDIVFLFSFHKQFVFNQSCIVDNKESWILKSCSNINIKNILKTCHGYSSMWKKKYPRISFIWVLPYPIDLYRYNETKPSETQTERINLYVHDEMNYWKLTQALITNLGDVLKGICHVLNPVLSVMAELEKSGVDNGTPKLSKEYLIDGVHPDEKLISTFTIELWNFFRFNSDIAGKLKKHVEPLISRSVYHSLF